MFTQVLRARLRRVCGVVALLCAGASMSAFAQQTGEVQGTTIVAESGVPLPGVHVFVDGTTIGAVSDGRGRFTLPQIPAGEQILVARFVGFETVRRPIQVRQDDVTRVEIAMQEATAALSEVVVTAIGERQSRADIAATVQSIDRETIERVKPAHPSEVMSRIPGVWVNTTSGEGHMTAIRQPLTTEPVYLFLENGVPTRSTGFFNHNALYEVNVPMAAGIEVMKGPGTALYGSDAIGGVINVTTRRAPDAPAAGLSMEGGSFGFGRLMLSSGTSTGAHGLRLDLNATKSDGWREATRYDRQSGTLSWDMRLPGASRLQTVASFSLIDQEPAGSSALPLEAYEADPTLNYTPISYRDVAAVRVSSAFERFGERHVIGVTPYFRYNEMSILPNWSLSYDPSVWSTQNYSAGMLARYRRDVGSTRLVGGVDLEISPGTQTEWRIEPERTGAVYTSFEELERIYDYDVSFRQASPYVHVEFAPVERLRLSGGLRADLLGYDYDNRLSVVTEGRHRRAASTTKEYGHLSPKLGVTYRISGGSSAFLAYRHAFRVPSEGQLFRQGSTTNTTDLEPVKADQIEAGVRMHFGRAASVELSGYRLVKTDDIITYTDATGTNVSTNAGETSHRGVEAGVLFRPIAGLQISGSYSYAVHRFESWQPSSTVDLSGNEMDVAPRTIAFVSAEYSPSFVPPLDVVLELMRTGEYWMDPENTVKYDGHSVVNLRADVQLPLGLEVFGRIVNLTDEHYAERATYNRFRGEEFAPALPRAVYLGVGYRISGEAGR